MYRTLDTSFFFFTVSLSEMEITVRFCTWHTVLVSHPDLCLILHSLLFLIFFWLTWTFYILFSTFGLSDQFHDDV